MRNSDPRNSPFLFGGIYHEFPYPQWLAKAKSKKDLDLLFSIICSTPLSFSQWTEKKVRHFEKRGIKIINPISYRIRVMRQGLVLMQESKFMCDLVENCIRHIYFIHLMANNISFKDLHGIYPKWEYEKKKYEKNRKTRIDENNNVPNEFILTMTFFDISTSILKNWKHLGKKNNYNGFRIYFPPAGKHSNKDQFEKEVVNFIRKRRNDIAHSKRLFTPEEARKLNSVCKNWVDSMNLNYNLNLSWYRTERPNFLKEI